MAESFSAQVDEWVRQTERRLEMVFKESVQTLFEEAQKPAGEGGNMPIDTGFLRNSFVAGLNGTTSLSGPDAYIAAIAGANIGDVIFGGWTAAYARRIEFGFVGKDSLGRNYNQTGRGFARKAAMRWPQIVRESADRARAAS